MRETVFRLPLFVLDTFKNTSPVLSAFAPFGLWSLFSRPARDYPQDEQRGAPCGSIMRPHVRSKGWKLTMWCTEWTTWLDQLRATGTRRAVLCQGGPDWLPWALEGRFCVPEVKNECFGHQRECYVPEEERFSRHYSYIRRTNGSLTYSYEKVCTAGFQRGSYGDSRKLQ